MTIEIAGAGFLNKGAELMLRTTVAQLRAAKPDVRLAVQPGADSCYEQRARLELASIFPTPSLFGPSARRLMLRSLWIESLLTAPLRATIPTSANRILGLIDRKDCDGLIDISGYAFGDRIGWAKCLNAYRRSHVYYKRRKPIIYMPQMFGPFKHPKVRKYFQLCCDEATRIYARDQISYAEVKGIVGDDDRLRLAPDITIFSHAEFDESDVAPDEEYACLVPNQKMLDKGSGEWGDTYLQRMVAAGMRIHSHHIRPVVVNHSSEDDDARLADHLTASLETELGAGEVARFTHEDPHGLKAFISRSKFLIGSRYHSIVAALSTGVPAILLGWAHKYDTLAREFGVSDLQHRGTDDIDQLLQLVDSLASSEKNQSYRDIIRSKRAEMRGHAERMWEDVYSLMSLV